MLPLLLAIALRVPYAVAIEPAPPPALPAWVSGRLFTSKRLHLGLRVHGYWDGAELAGAVTLQVTGAGL